MYFQWTSVILLLPKDGKISLYKSYIVAPFVRIKCSYFDEENNLKSNLCSSPQLESDFTNLRKEYRVQGDWFLPVRQVLHAAILDLLYHNSDHVTAEPHVPPSRRAE